MASMFSVISDLSRELQYQLKKHKEEQDSTSVGWMSWLLKQPVPDNRLFSSSTTTNDGSILEKILECQLESKFLSVFIDAIQHWSDADKLLVPESVYVKVAAALIQIAKALETAILEEYISRNPLKLQNLLENFLSKTKTLKAELGQILDNFLSGGSSSFSSSSSCCSYEQVQLQSPLCDYPAWTKFFDSVRENLLYLRDHHHHHFKVASEEIGAFHQELRLIQTYLDAMQKHACHAADGVVNQFFIHIASTVVYTAIRSCSYWFNHGTATTDPTVAEHDLVRLVDLQSEIDFANNPVFLELNLKFPSALKKSSSRPSDCERDLLRHFPNYLFPKRRDFHLDILLEMLVAYFVDDKIGGYLCEEKEEDVQTSFAEIQAMLTWVAYLYEPLRKGITSYLPKCEPEVVVKVCLLRLDLLFKEQIYSGTFSLLYDPFKIEELDELLGLLSTYSKKLPQNKMYYEEQTLAFVQEMEKAVKSLYHANKITKHMVENFLYLLLCQVVLFKAESRIMELLKSNASMMASQKNQIECFIEKLKIFRVVANQIVKKRGNMKLNLGQIEAAARRITYFSYSCLVTEDMIEKIVILSSDLSDKVTAVMAELSKVNNPFLVSNFPKINGLGFLDFLLQNLAELLTGHPASIKPVQLEEINLHLKSLKSFLIKSSESGIQNQEFKNLQNRVFHVAYKVDYAIDSFEVDAHWQHFLWFYDLLQETRLLTKQASQIREAKCDAVDLNVNQSSIRLTARASRPEHNEVVLDLVDEEKTITNRLIRGSSHREVVSIVGMGGIGKTTLARKVYNSSKVTRYFHCHAWCTLFQEYGRTEVLREILSGIRGLTEEIRGMKLEDLEAKLRQSLLRNKYLIVMDDVWDISAWKDLERSLPDDLNGSRILITSRRRDVALEANDRDPHSLRPLSDDESWELLEKKVFHSECCPEELLSVGKEIAQHCEGLPLAIVAIAGLLEKTEKRQIWWQKIVSSLSSQILKEPKNRCMEILELSYNHLPDPLKACFLYLGALVEDKDIPVSKLIRLWIAEGIINKSESKTLEEVAEGHLLDLIDRSLVMISKRKSNEAIKACRIHDLLRDMCQSKAKEEKFFQLVTRYDEPYASFHGSNYGSEFDDYYPSNPVTFESHRLSICLRRKVFVQSKPCGPITRSLIFFALTDTYPTCPYDITFISQHFKLLRVLDLESINMGYFFPAEIPLLVQLRYLAVSGDIDSVPPSIANLWKLETFVVKGLRGKVLLPDTVWSMARLRHLHVNNLVLQDGNLTDSRQLDNLVTFSSPCLSYENSETIIRRLPNLYKLRCIFQDSWDSFNNCNQFPRLDSLTQLESLRVLYSGRGLNPGEFNFPSNLKKLTLSYFRLPWDHISVIGRLQHLEILKLLSGAFEGPTWDMREGEFQELKFLKLDNLNIAQWDATSDHLPKLQRLVLQNCKNLEKIPYEFADITTLEIIEVQWCGESTEESAKEIGDDTREINVLIKH